MDVILSRIRRIFIARCPARRLICPFCRLSLYLLVYLPPNRYCITDYPNQQNTPKQQCQCRSNHRAHPMPSRNTAPNERPGNEKDDKNSQKHGSHLRILLSRQELGGTAGIHSGNLHWKRSPSQLADLLPAFASGNSAPSQLMFRPVNAIVERQRVSRQILR